MDGGVAMAQPAVTMEEYQQFFQSNAANAGGGMFPNFPNSASGWAGGSGSEQQAAAARQRASARQQAKRAQNKSTSEQDEDAGSDSGAEDDGQEDGEELDEDAMVPATATKGKSAKRGKSHSENDKDHKRLKRLLRNRVSAQQARERRKVYVAGMESRAKDLEDKTAVLEQRVATLERENFVLRQVLKSSMAAPPPFQEIAAQATQAPDAQQARKQTLRTPSP